MKSRAGHVKASGIAAGITTAKPLRLRRIAQINHLQAAALVGDVGAAAGDVDCPSVAAGIAATHAQQLSRIAHVDDLQTVGTIRHVGQVADNVNAKGGTAGIVAAEALRGGDGGLVQLGVGGAMPRAGFQPHDGRIYAALTARGGILVGVRSESRAADALSVLLCYGGGNAAIGAWTGRV